MQHSPQIYEMLNELREDELRRINVHRIDALTSHQPHPVMRATIAGAIVRAGLMLDAHAASRETERRASRDRIARRAIIAPEGDPAWHW
jgi:hypothetical protein